MAISTKQWPVLTHYDQKHLSKIALPLGGIGTGTVSLGGRGDFRDWEIVNRPAKGFKPRNTFFALYTRDQAGHVVTRALEGAIEPHEYEGEQEPLLHGESFRLRTLLLNVVLARVSHVYPTL